MRRGPGHVEARRPHNTVRNCTNCVLEHIYFSYGGEPMVTTSALGRGAATPVPKREWREDVGRFEEPHAAVTLASEATPARSPRLRLRRKSIVVMAMVLSREALSGWKRDDEELPFAHLFPLPNPNWVYFADPRSTGSPAARGRQSGQRVTTSYPGRRTNTNPIRGDFRCTT